MNYAMLAHFTDLSRAVCILTKEHFINVLCTSLCWHWMLCLNFAG